jgi:hypothetical protein
MTNSIQVDQKLVARQFIYDLKAALMLKHPEAKFQIEDAIKLKSNQRGQAYTNLHILYGTLLIIATYSGMQVFSSGPREHNPFLDALGVPTEPVKKLTRQYSFTCDIQDAIKQISNELLLESI